MIAYLRMAVLLTFMHAPSLWAVEANPCGPPGAYVSVGDTLDQLVATCGNPTSTQEYEETPPDAGKRVRWYYTANFLNTERGDPDLSLTQGARFYVEFVNGKVDLIYAYDEVFGLYDYCGPVQGVRRSIEQGDSMAYVRETCGEPSFENSIQDGPPPPPQKVLEYTYQFDPTIPPTVVTIKDGVVTQVQ